MAHPQLQSAAPCRWFRPVRQRVLLRRWSQPRQGRRFGRRLYRLARQWGLPPGQAFLLAQESRAWELDPAPGPGLRESRQALAPLLEPQAWRPALATVLRQVFAL